MTPTFPPMLRRSSSTPKTRRAGILTHELSSGCAPGTLLRQGKTFEIIVKEKDEKVALSKAKDMCEKLLANLTIEDYSVKAIKE